MARVAVTKKLVAEVQHIILHMERQAIETEAPVPPSPEYDFQELVDALWGDDIHLRGMLMRLSTAKRLGWQLEKFCRGSKIAVFTKGTHGSALQMPIAECMEPCIYWGPPKEDPSAYSIACVTLPPEHPLAAPFVEHQRLEQGVERRFDEIRGDVIGFLRQCPSLNEAVKLVPEGAMYIPGWAKHKMDEKVVRTKRVPPILPTKLPDVERMVVTAITHRMGSS